jgi:vitamin B12 transporter
MLRSFIEPARAGTSNSNSTRLRAALRWRLLPLLAPVFMALPTWAQSVAGTQPPEDTVVVTATRTPLQPSDVIADVVVVTREDIERQGVGDVSDLLRNTGAVEFVRTGGPGQTTSLFIRGAETRHTLVLIDGIRIDSQSTGGAPWESIALSSIDRIEIVKGPASAMYGSDAIGGVVQIFTRKGSGAPKVDLGVAAGSLRSARAEVGVRGSAGIFDYALSGATERSDGIVLIPDPADFNYNPSRAGYQKHHWSARLGAQVDAADRIEFIGLSSHLDSQFNDYSPTALAHATEDTSAEKLSWRRQWSSALNTQLGVGESRARYSDPTDGYLTETRIRNYALDGSHRFTPQQQLLFVAERTENVLSDSSLTASGPGTSQRNENGVGLGYLAIFGALDAQANVRHDEDSEFGSANTGSLGLGYKLSPAFKLVASAGTAFRAPTIYQNSSVYGPLSVANGQSLQAESGRNAEIGLRYAEGSTEVSVTAYRNLVDHLVNFGAAGTCLSPYGCYVNVQRARLQGVSLAAETQVAAWRLSGTLEFQAPRDLSTGKLLPRRAREFGTLHAQTQWLGWELGSGLQISGRRDDDAANTQPLGGYTLLNLDAGYRLTPDLKLQINLDNAFDRVYQTAQGYAQLPRTVMVSLRYALAP